MPDAAMVLIQIPLCRKVSALNRCNSVHRAYLKVYPATCRCVMIVSTDPGRILEICNIPNLPRIDLFPSPYASCSTQRTQLGYRPSLLSGVHSYVEVYNDYRRRRRISMLAHRNHGISGVNLFVQLIKLVKYCTRLSGHDESIRGMKLNDPCLNPWTVGSPRRIKGLGGMPYLPNDNKCDPSSLWNKHVHNWRDGQMENVVHLEITLPRTEPKTTSGAEQV